MTVRPPYQLIRPCLVIVAVLLLGAASRTPVPLYDGIGFPDEPYRYITAPSGVTNSQFPASSIDTSAPLSELAAQAVFNSDEQGPQVSIVLNARDRAFGSNTTHLKIVARPLAPDAASSRQSAKGNIYAVSLTSNNGSSMSPSGQDNTIRLRLPQKDGAQAVMKYRAQANQPWKTLSTNKIGNDIYEAPLAGSGQYALFTNTAAAGKVFNWALLGIPLLVIGAVAVLFLLRRFGPAPASPTKKS